MAEEKKRGGGPKTAEGKARSSGNSTKHGLRAKGMRLLADETPEEYEAHCRSWEKELRPGSFLEAQLMKQLVLNSWLMERANRRYLEVEAEGDGHAIELMQRYKTTAERVFYRSVEAVKRLAKDTTQAFVTMVKLEREKETHTKAGAATSQRLAEAEKKLEEWEAASRLKARSTEGAGERSEHRDRPADHYPRNPGNPNGEQTIFENK